MGIKENIALQVKIAELQAALDAANVRIAELEAIDPITVIHRDPVEVEVIKYVDNPDLIAQIQSMQARLRDLDG